MLQGALLKSKSIDPTNEIQDIREESDEAFIAKSREHLESLEIIRKEKFKIYQRRKRLAIPTAVVIAPALTYIDYWLLWLQSSNDDKGAGITVAFLGMLYAWVTSPKRQYTKSYKQTMLPEIAKLFGDFVYTLGGKVPSELMMPSKILPSHDRYKSEDHFSGIYKGVQIQFCEVDFQQKRKSKNSTYYVTVFKGLAILLDMKTKKFCGHTILDRERGKITSWFKEKTSGLKEANLVDPEFEKLFDVYTNDQVEARYLIDPAMIERIKGLQVEYEGENLIAAFYESKMLILIQSKHNHFEPANITIPATDAQSLLGMKKEVGEILSVIDRLNLYDPAAVHAKAS